MDKQQEGAYMDIQLDFLVPLSTSPADLWLRTNLYGQLDFGSWGPYVQFPFATTYPSAEDLDSRSVAGQLEFGAFYQHTVDKNWDLFVRLGISVAAASEARDDVAVNQAGRFGRVTDTVNSYPFDVAIRVSFSPEYRLGMFMMRLDAGFDFTVDEVLSTDPIYFRGNIALGVDLGMASLAIESANIGVINGDAENVSDRFQHTLGINATFDTGALEPYIGIASPMHEDLLGEVLIITAGLLFGAH